MFSLLSNSPLSEVLAPPLTSLEEFTFQWNTFSDFFSQKNTENNNELNKCRIESTNLPAKLEKMAELVTTEQNKYIKNRKHVDGSIICPSLEYLLQNNILDTLSILAQADLPLGIYPHIMLFFIRLLNETNSELIPQKCVYTSLNKLLIICAKIPAGPYESSETIFLDSITEQICRKPPFLNFFLKDSFPLINSLLSLLSSPDSNISKRAGDLIIKLASIFNESADEIVCKQTPFCSKIINKIINNYNEIPRSLSPQEIEIAIYTFRNDSACNSSYTKSVRKFLCFLKWFIFFDMLIYHLPDKSLLVKYLLVQFKTDFMEACLLPDLNGDGFNNEIEAIDNVFLTTVLLTNCLKNTESVVLFNSICEFLIIPSEDDLPVAIPIKRNNRNFDRVLFKRCELSKVIDQFDVDQRTQIFKLASATMQLFEDILSRPSLKVVNNLITRHISKRHYLDRETKSDNLDNADISEQLINKFHFFAIIKEIESISGKVNNLPNISSAHHVDMKKLDLILFYFTSLIPSELKFSNDNESNDYEAYLREAIKGFDIFLNFCYANWPTVSTDANIESYSDEEQQDCSEGPFLQMIFDNLNSMLSLPYEINLQVFSLIAKLSLIPNEYINEYILDPTITLNNVSRNLFGILHKLIEQLQISVKGISNLQQKLHDTKIRLLGEHVKQDSGLNAENVEIENILRSLIVLDEFCKEISAIVYSKNTILKLCQTSADNSTTEN